MTDVVYTKHEGSGGRRGAIQASPGAAAGSESRAIYADSPGVDLRGEKMAELCRELDISRKTGYKIFNRFKDCGLEGLTDRSRRPYRQANRLPFKIETLTVQLKREHPT